MRLCPRRPICTNAWSGSLVFKEIPQKVYDLMTFCFRYACPATDYSFPLVAQRIELHWRPRGPCSLCTIR